MGVARSGLWAPDEWRILIIYHETPCKHLGQQQITAEFSFMEFSAFIIYF